MKFVLASIIATIFLSGCDEFKSYTSETTYSDAPLTIELKELKSQTYKFNFSAVDEKGRSYTSSNENCHNWDYYVVGNQYLMVLEKTTRRYEDSREKHYYKIKPCGVNAPLLKSKEVIS